MNGVRVLANDEVYGIVEESQPRPSPGSSDAAQAPAFEANIGTKGMAPLDSSGGELRRGEGLCQGSSPAISDAMVYATPGVHTRPTVRLLNPHDTEPEPPEGEMEVSESEEDSLPLTQPPLFEVSLPCVLSKKARLRRKLLRADHHRVFLHGCRKDDVTPRGLRLSRQVHPIQGQGSDDTASRIENILHNAEKGILEALIEHYDKMVDSTTRQLQNIEEDLSSRPDSDKDAIETSMHRAELSEDHLRSSLEKTRTEKFKQLKGSGPSHTTPRRKVGSKSKRFPTASPSSENRTRQRKQSLRPGPARDVRPAAPARSVPTQPSLPPTHTATPHAPLPFPPAQFNPSPMYFPSPFHMSNPFPYPQNPFQPQWMPMAFHQGYGMAQAAATPQPVQNGGTDRIKNAVMEVVSQLSKCTHLKRRIHTDVCRAYSGLDPPLTSTMYHQRHVHVSNLDDNVEPVPHGKTKLSENVRAVTRRMQPPKPNSRESELNVNAHAPTRCKQTPKGNGRKTELSMGTRAPTGSIPIPKCTNVVNMSGVELTPTMRSLLDKGLSFVPSTLANRSNLHLKMDLDILGQKYIDKYVGTVPPRASRILKNTLTSIKYDLGNSSTSRVPSNLSMGERLALKKLVRNENLVICKADKGDITVIMTTAQYLDMAYKHLGDRNTYQPLETDPTRDIVTQFNSYLDTCLCKRVLTKSQHERLYLKPSEVNTQTIYFLPKVHKDPVKPRPIVSCTGGPTSNASAYLDRLLQPHMKRVKSYLSNSTELVRMLRKLKVPPNAYLVTLDIESLYTNITHEEAIASFLRRFGRDPQKVFLLDLLKFVLKNNVFQFDGHVFTQICGIAMGTKLAPALATIYVSDLEEAFIGERDRKPDLWVRYIDDVFMIWSHTREELDVFLQELNTRQERIRFTAEVQTQSCNFLDLTIYKSPNFLKTGLLSTKIYYKPTNTFSYPLGSSHIPKHVHKSIAVGEMTRLLRATESPALYDRYQKKLIKHFARREYPKSILRILRSLTHNRRLETLYRVKKRVSMNRPLPFITEYKPYDPPLSTIFRRRWQHIYNDHKFYSLLPNAPFATFKGSKSVAKLLSAKRRRFETEKHIPNLDLGEVESFRFTRFNRHRTAHRMRGLC